MFVVERQGDVLVWTIDRPAQRNALDHATLHALADAVEDAKNDKTARAAVLTSTGHVFVSGGDLHEMRDRHSPQDAEKFSDLGYDLFHAIGELRFPVIAAMPGPAIGGGAEIAMACDLRVAEVRCKISFKQVRMGVTTAWGTIPRLVAAVGSGAAARLLYTAHEIGAAEAKLLGLVDEVTENGLAKTTALAWANDIALGSPTAVAHMKRLVAMSSERDVRAHERRTFIDTWSGPDHREAVDAYFERRPPKF